MARALPQTALHHRLRQALPFPRVGLIAALLWIVGAASPLGAWSAGGHKVVALIAYSRLDDATRAKVVEILKHHPLWDKDFAGQMPQDISSSSETEQQRWIFAQASVWPDMARGYKAPPMDYHRPTWHYIDAPIYLDEASRAALEGKVSINLEVTWTAETAVTVQNAAQTVDFAVRALKDPAAPPEIKGLMMSWLIHVVGDMHQPLHCAMLLSKHTFPTGDRGGNSIKFLLQSDIRHPVPLHSFWDQLLKQDSSLNEASATMAGILADPAVVEKATAAAPNLDVTSWVREGRSIAEKYVYTDFILQAVRNTEHTNPAPTIVTVPVSSAQIGAYGKAAGPIAQERAAIGGCRLAAMLKDALKE